MFFTQEQLQIAKKADLSRYLMRYHGNLFKAYGTSIRLKDNQSLSIKKGGFGYRDFATDETGNSIDFLVNYLNYDLVDAVLALNGEIAAYSIPDRGISHMVLDNKDIQFPEPIDGEPKVLYSYLRNRGISERTIKKALDYNLLYQEKNHYKEKGYYYNNIVFINLKRTLAEVRGTSPVADAKCGRMDKCTDYSPTEHRWCKLMNTCQRYKKKPYHRRCSAEGISDFWWFQAGENPEICYVCEGAIDALSLYDLNRLNDINHQAYYVSLVGIDNADKIIDLIQPYVHIILAVDNDPAGAKCREKHSDLDYIIPKAKDWNDDLQHIVKGKNENLKNPAL